MVKVRMNLYKTKGAKAPFVLLFNLVSIIPPVVLLQIIRLAL